MDYRILAMLIDGAYEELFKSNNDDNQRVICAMEKLDKASVVLDKLTKFEKGGDMKLSKLIVQKGTEEMRELTFDRLVIDGKEKQIADLLVACKALLVMMDNGSCPRKLDEALSWKQNDALARNQAKQAIERAESA